MIGVAARAAARLVRGHRGAVRGPHLLHQIRARQHAAVGDRCADKRNLQRRHQELPLSEAAARQDQATLDSIIDRPVPPLYE